MTQSFQLRRVLLLMGLLGAAFLGLGYRLVDLQVLRHDELTAKSQGNTQHEYWSAPQRGDILDAKGNPLATSLSANRICANPSVLCGQQALVAHTLAPLLQMDETDLIQKLTVRITKNAAGEMVTNNLNYVRLKDNIPDETWQKIQATMTNLTFGFNAPKLSRAERNQLHTLRHYAIFSEAQQTRIYPNGALAANVVGFSGAEEFKVGGRAVSQISGRDGIEFSMNKTLSGVSGWRVTETDRQQRELVALRDQDVQPHDGMDVMLTIDAAIQHIVETNLADAMKAHSPISITGIVMRPRTGEILAMATLPTYDPNIPATITPESRNRVITDVVEPGSTFKIVVVSGALNEKLVTLNDVFDCEHGHFAFAGRVLHDHESLGLESVQNIIMKSSNIGAAKIGIRLGEKSLHDYASDFGFGQRTGITLTGEANGILYPINKWSKVSIAQIPMGHGVAVTRLQMIMAMGALANNGWLMRPMIVSQLLDHNNGTIVQKYAPQRVHQVVTEATAKLMVEALKTVVTKTGTAPGAALEHYTVAGKTGTAQKVVNGTYAEHKFIASFIGFFPADNPELCISIVMDEPKEGYYGGQVCGPVFKKIAERCASYLNLPPDKESSVTNSVSGLVAAAQPRRLNAP